MLQEIVIKVQFKSSKSRSKAMRIAAMASGVISVEIDGDEVVVVGEGVDAVRMTRLMRKKVGRASLEFVAEINDEEENY